MPSDLRTTDAFSSQQQPQLGHQVIASQLNNIRGRLNSASSPVNSLASQYTQLPASQRTVQTAWLPKVHPYASTSGCMTSTAAATPQLTGVQVLQNTVGQRGLVSDHNWRPTGRMRGSVSGNEYNAVLSHYLVHPSQLGTRRPSISTSVSTSERLPDTNSSGANLHGSSVRQTNWRNSGLGN